MIHLVDAVVGCAQRVHADLEGLIDWHALWIDVDAKVAPIAVHLHSVQRCLGSLRADHADVEVLVIVAQRLGVPVGVSQAAILQHQAEGVGHVLVSHQHVADLWVHAAHRVSLVQQLAIFGVLEQPLDLHSQQDALGGGAVQNVAARLVGLGLLGHAHAGHSIHRLGQPLGEAISGSHHVYAKAGLVAVTAWPDHGKVGVHLLVQFQCALDAVDGRLTHLGVGVRERAPFPLALVEQVWHDGDHADAGVAGELLPQVQVLIVDLVGVMGLHPGQAIVGQAGGDVQPLGDGQWRAVGLVETDATLGKEPDPCGEFQVQFERLHVFE